MAQDHAIKNIKAFIEALIAHGETEKAILLLTPENIIVSDEGITLANWAPQSDAPVVFPGFSAPEIYDTAPDKPAAGETAAVYFLGGLLHTLLYGAPPPDAASRQQADTLLPEDTLFNNVIHSAMALDAAERPATLMALYNALEAAQLKEAEEQQRREEEALEAEVRAVAAQLAGTPARTTAPAQEARETPPPAPPAVTPAPAQEEAAAPAAPPPQEPAAQAVPEQQQTEVASPAAQVEDTASPPAPAQETYTQSQPDPPAETTMTAAQAPAEQTPPVAASPMVSPEPAAWVPPQQSGDAPPWVVALRRGIAVACALFILLGAAGIYTAVQRRGINRAFESGDWQAVVSGFGRAPWLKAVGAEHLQYAEARLLWQEGKLDDAQRLLKALGNDFNAPEALQQIEYETAINSLNAKKYVRSLQQFEALNDYGDSPYYAECLRLYLQAQGLEEPYPKYQIYLALGDFADSPALAQQMLALIYQAAVQDYTDKEYDDAKTEFAKTPGYEQTDLYLEAIALFENSSLQAAQNREAYARLYQLAADIDVGNILLNNAFMTLYLEGNWLSDTGGGFSLTPGVGYTFTQLPLKGDIYFTQGGLYGSLQALPAATLSYVSRDEFVLTFADSGAAYTFRRQA